MQWINYYLGVRILQFGKNLPEDILAKCAGIVMLWQTHLGIAITEVHLITELLWARLRNF